MLAILLPTMPGTVARFAWLVIPLALVSLLYGSLAALGQRDLKRLVAYTSVNHMAFVLLALPVAGLGIVGGNPDLAHLAVNGAAVQMVSHGLLTGAMFLMIGMLQHRAGTRDIDRFGDLLGRLPGYAGLFAVLSFGSLGLPGLSGFIAEFQVIGATLLISMWIGAIAVLGLVITTGLYLHMLGRLLLGKPPEAMPDLPPMSMHESWSAGTLAALSVLIGVLPGTIMPMIAAASSALAGS